MSDHLPHFFVDACQDHQITQLMMLPLHTLLLIRGALSVETRHYCAVALLSWRPLEMSAMEAEAVAAIVRILA